MDSVHPGISIWAVIIGWGSLPLAKVTCLFCWLGEQASLQHDVTWGSSLCHPEDQDLCHWWLPKSWQLPEYKQLPKCWQLREWLIYSIFSSSIAAATSLHWCTYLARANASSHESHCMAASHSYVVQCTAANSGWGLGLQLSAGPHVCSASSSVEGHLCQRHSLMESRPSWQMHSSIPSLLWLLLGSHCSWYTSW